MENIFLSVMERIGSNLPEIRTIDEDTGQLQMGESEDGYPVIFPAVFIGNIESDWTDLGGGAQKGRCSITVRLALDCYDDTHYNSGTEEKIRERLQLNKKLFTTLQGFTNDKRTMGRLYRTKSSDFTLSGGIKVYETIFAFEVHDAGGFIR